MRYWSGTQDIELSELRQAIYSDEVQNQLNKDIDFPMIIGYDQMEIFWMMLSKNYERFCYKKGFLQGLSIIT